jgi:hypothetical protein
MGLSPRIVFVLSLRGSNTSRDQTVFENWERSHAA